MRSKILLQWSRFILGAVVLAFSTILILLPDDTAVGSIEGVIPPEQMSLGFPVRLIIPKINVDAGFEYVGLAPDGAMGAPQGPADVAWFNRSPRPGEKGSSLVAGHFGWRDNIPAVFDNLHELKKGDKVYVIDDKGVSTVFVVRELRRYDLTSDASSVFISNDGEAHLNLITCEGVWDPVSRSYSKRLVVFTDKE